MSKNCKNVKVQKELFDNFNHADLLADFHLLITFAIIVLIKTIIGLTAYEL